MFHDLDLSLQAMLHDADSPADLRAAEVSFETPDKGYAPTQRTVNLFLHDVAENRELRDQARMTDLTDGVYTIGPPPVRMDCTYLSTAWSAQAGGLKVNEEHQLLGLALSWMSRFTTVEDRFLQGALKTPAQPYSVPLTVARTKEGQTMGAFWSALGISPRPAFSVTVTIAMPTGADVEHYPRMEKVVIGSTTLSSPVLTGRVLDHRLVPVDAAKVGVVGTPQTVTVGPGGEFTFAGLEFGTQKLLVQVAGQPDVELTLHYQAHAQIHNVILPGP